MAFYTIKTELIRYPQGKNYVRFDIPNSVKTIGREAFWGCLNLTTITIPQSVNEIKELSFYNCSNMLALTIPKFVSIIGNSAFSFCNSLEEVYYGTDCPIKANESIFSNYTKPTLYIKASALDRIKTTIPWNLFSKIEIYDFANVGTILVDDNAIDYSAPYEVYNLSGMMLGDSKDGLYPGIYILRQGNRVEKILVK